MAEADGRLAVGDHIMKIDGVDVSNERQETVAQVLKVILSYSREILIIKEEMTRHIYLHII